MTCSVHLYNPYKHGHINASKTQENEMSECDIQEIFSSVGKDYGFRSVTAAFSPENDLKVCWMRTGPTIDFWVSDYLESAPEDILESVAEAIYRKIRGSGDDSYPERVVEFLISRDFAKENRESYLQRKGGVSTDRIGRHQDLDASYRRLVRRGLVEREDDLVIGWVPLGTKKDVGNSSVLMRTALLNRRLDNPFMDDDLIDYCLFTQITFVQMGFYQDSRERRERLEELIGSYPHHERYESALRDMGLGNGEELSPEC